MKHKKINWDHVAWTPFQRAVRPDNQVDALDPPTVILMNSIYQVSVYARGEHPVFGDVCHLSFKTHDKQARHDWREMQRIKNEVCGPECDAVEIYPAESKLVDAANQYHLFVFRTYKLALGFNERLVSDGAWRNSKQRPWKPGERPADCLSSADFERLYQEQIAKSTTAAEALIGVLAQEQDD